MEEIIISLATFADINQCALIDRSMGFFTSPSIEQKTVSERRLLIATIGSTVTGYLRYGFLWDAEMPYIQMIRVEQAYRRKGIGRKLIAALEDTLREQNIKYLLSSTDETNETSLQFHKILGFQECGTLDINDDGKREIFLKKELSP